MKSVYRFVPAMLLTAALISPGLAAEAAKLTGAARALQAAFNSGDPAAVLKARAGFEALSAAEPSVALLHYWVAVADWRGTPLFPADKKAQAKRYADDGIARCEQALKLDPKLADALALEGNLLGMSIQFDPGSVMTLGPQGDACLNRALGMAPRNPRVWLLNGITTLNKPAQFGGGADKAMPMFERAVELFAADSVTDSLAADSLAVDWGRDDASLWAGRCAMIQQQYAAAAEHYRAALRANPGNGWVRTRLLPDAEQALAKQKRP